jgi:hypothetical protein
MGMREWSFLAINGGITGGQLLGEVRKTPFGDL